MVVVGRVARGEHERVLDPYPLGDRHPHAVVDVAGGHERVRLPVVGAQRHPVGPVPEHGRDEVAKVPRGRALADEEPHPLAALLLGLVELGALVVRLDARRQVGVELAAAHPGRVAVHAAVARRGDLGEDLGVAADDAGEVHDLGDADGAVGVEQLGELAVADLGARALEGGGGHAARRADPEGEREPASGLGERDDAGNPEHVRDLVRVGRDRRRAVREHAADELVHPELRRLEVHVGVDEAGREGGTGDVDRLECLPRTPPGDDAVDDGEVGRDPLARARHEHAATGEQQVGRGVAPGDGEDARGPTARRHGRSLRRAADRDPGRVGGPAPMARRRWPCLAAAVGRYRAPIGGLVQGPPSGDAARRGALSSGG